MKVWDLINSKAFKHASDDTSILYADGSLGYVRLGGYTQTMHDFKTVLEKKEGTSLKKRHFLEGPLLILNNELYVSSDGLAPLNTQGFVVVLEKCGLVIKERDMV